MASLDKNLFIKFNHLTDEFSGTSTILGTSQKALKDGLDSIKNTVINTTNGVKGGGSINNNLTFEADDTVLRTSTKAQTKSGPLTVGGKMTMNGDAEVKGNIQLTGSLTSGTVPWERLSNHKQVIAGDGLTGGGVLSDSRTLAVNNTVLRTTRKIITGSGIKGGGDLTADRSLSVDDTVLRTNSNNQTKSGSLSVLGDLSGSNVTAINFTSITNIEGESIFAGSNLAVNFDSANFVPEAPLHVNGDAVIENVLLAKEDVQIESDRRIKDDIVRIQNPLELLKNVNGYTYVLKNKENKKRHMGLIAQEVMETMPEVVREGSNGIYSVAYHNLIGVLVEAIHEVQAKAEKNEEVIAALQKEVDELKY